MKMYCTSPGCTERICPCAAIRSIWAGVNFGNIFSIRELVRGSPLRVLDIVAIYSVVATHKSSPRSFHLSVLTMHAVCCLWESICLHRVTYSNLSHAESVLYPDTTIIFLGLLVLCSHCFLTYSIRLRRIFLTQYYLRRYYYYPKVICSLQVNKRNQNR